MTKNNGKTEFFNFRSDDIILYVIPLSMTILQLQSRTSRSKFAAPCANHPLAINLDDLSLSSLAHFPAK